MKTNIGLMILLCGIAAADSPNLLIPLALVVCGWLMIRKEAKAERDDE